MADLLVYLEPGGVVPLVTLDRDGDARFRRSCGGLGYHTKVDPILWRALLIVLGPATLIPYIVLTFLTEKK